jgi:hypothetical protein
MRKLWINLLGPAMFFAATASLLAEEPKADPNAPKDKEAPAKSKLEQMLETALKHNPDIRVADAKVREADAELSRTRLAVTQKVVQMYNNLESARATVQIAEDQFKRLRELRGKGVVDAATIDEAEAKLRQAKAELAKLDAEVPYLLGQHNPKDKDAAAALLRGIVVEANPDEDYSSVVTRLMVARMLIGEDARLALKVTPREPNGSMSEKVRAALDKTITIDLHESTPSELLAFCRDKIDRDLNIVIKDPGVKFAVGEGSFHLKAVPFGAVLQCMEDSLPKHCFVIRDYGIVLVARDRVPPGAMTLQEFWKSKEREKPKEEKK